MAKEQEILFGVAIDRSQEGKYFSVPFEVPEGMDKLEISYWYDRFDTRQQGEQTVRVEKTIIDLALCAENGYYLGCSGADRDSIWISAWGASRGYEPHPIHSGTWSVVVGAYHVAPEGTVVHYAVRLTPASRRLFRGDLHMHTRGSDGDKTAEEVVREAEYRGLDYIFLTDHNNHAQNLALPSSETVTVLPGMEWTHFAGHANMLGVARPLDGVYYANSREETAEKLAEARSRGAFVTINHPFCPDCGWKWGMEEMPYDGIEVWNGATTEQANLDCLTWWHEKLCRGARIPIVGGSDYHGSGFCRGIGCPTTCVYAESRSAAHLMEALRTGHGYVTFQPKAPVIQLRCGSAMMGDVIHETCAEIELSCEGCADQDLISVWTARGCVREIRMQGNSDLHMKVEICAQDRFCRLELRREWPAMGRQILAAVTNPICLNPGVEE